MFPPWCCFKIKLTLCSRSELSHNTGDFFHSSGLSLPLCCFLSLSHLHEAHRNEASAANELLDHHFDQNSEWREGGQGGVMKWSSQGCAALSSRDICWTENLPKIKKHLCSSKQCRWQKGQVESKCNHFSEGRMGYIKQSRFLYIWDGLHHK